MATPPFVCFDRTANNEGSHQEYKTADDTTGQHPQFAYRTCVAAVWPSEPNYLSSTPALPSTATSRALSKTVLNNNTLNNADKHTQPSWRCNSSPSVSNGSKAHSLSKRSCFSHRSTGTKRLSFLGDLQETRGVRRRTKPAKRRCLSAWLDAMPQPHRYQQQGRRPPQHRPTRPTRRWQPACLDAPRPGSTQARQPAPDPQQASPEPEQREPG